MKSILNLVTCPLLSFTGYTHIHISFDDIMDGQTCQTINSTIWDDINAYLGTNIDNSQL